MSERKLKAWEEAGVIDAATAARIREWDAAHGRPLALWAVVGLAGLAIAIGIISLIAANWDVIPAMVRLGLHLALLIGMAGFLWWRGADLAQRQPWFHEAILFVFAALGLGFMGHVGQAYQTTSPLWKPITFWLVLFAPLLLSQGRSWLTALGLFVGLAFACWLSVDGMPTLYGEHELSKFSTAMIHWALMTSLPMLALALAAFMRSRSSRVDFWRHLQQVALIYAVGGVMIISVFYSLNAVFGGGDGLDRMEGGRLVQSAVALAIGGLVWFTQKSRTGLGIAATLALVAILNIGAPFLGDLAMLVLWGSIAAIAHYVGWRGVFQIAVGLFAVWLINLSFQWSDDLLGTGVSFIIAGVLTLLIAFGAVRFSKRFAPPKEEEPA